VSSLAAAGPCCDPEPLTETAEEHPVSVYGRSKLEAERALLGFKDRLDVTIVRPPGVYGPRDTEFLIYYKLIKIGIAPIPLGGKSRLDLIHVFDLIRGVLEAARSDRAVGETYFLRGPGAPTMRDLAEGIARALGKNPLYLNIPRWVATLAMAISDIISAVTKTPNILSKDKLGEMLAYWECSDTKAVEHFGFRAQYTLEEGLEETARWYREQGWI
jgi:nucleoside-diphosphate-sugar epimerase